MKLDITKYFMSFVSGNELLEQLSKKVFLKTEIDIVYASYTNWERHELLIIDEQYDKGQRNKLNYFQYIWVKIVENLTDYGFNYRKVKELKDAMFSNMLSRDFLSFANDNKSHFVNLSSGQIDNEIDFTKELSSLYFPVFYGIVMNCIIHHEKTNILVGINNPADFDVFSSSILNEHTNFNTEQDFSLNFSKTHLSISLSSIISNFLIEGSSPFENRITDIISKEEHTILTLIRNKHKSIKSIKVIYKNEKPEMVEIESVKKVELESRLMEHIQKREYSEIVVKTSNGKVTYFKKTNKIKL
tara:strand:- start:163 stop:1065 length:903 start_codon:yes stop_codon:yes gene_type:complete